MQIIVIDNYQWNDQNAWKTWPAPYCISTSDKTREELFAALKHCHNTYRQSESTYFLINIHCRYKNSFPAAGQQFFLQDQLGVDVYRHLLKAYEGSLQRLKVGFFSPVPRHQLLIDKPENYVIHFLPFFETPFSWQGCVDGLIRWPKYPVFNLGSENLLSGFKLYSAERDKGFNNQVATGNKKVMIIDDQASEWETTFSEIFRPGSLVTLTLSSQQQFRNDFKNRYENGFISTLKEKIKHCALVLSDFYLLENHDPARWFDKERVVEMSGYQLFSDIKKIDKGVPVVIHSMSNKISFYKVFDQSGVDDWIVKDTRILATPTEKMNNYIAFKETIESILENPTYHNLRSYWNEIKKVENTTVDTWWLSFASNPPRTQYSSRSGRHSMIFRPLNEKQKLQAVQILKSSWYALRRMLNREVGFEEHRIDDKSIFKKDHFTAAAVCNNLGKIIEMLGIRAGIPDFSLLINFLLQVRNSASHYADHELFEVNDALIYMDYILAALNNDASNEEQFKKLCPDRYIGKIVTKGSNDEFPYALLWLYLQFYNSECSRISMRARAMMLNRLKKLFTFAKKDNTFRKAVEQNPAFLKKHFVPNSNISDYEYSDNNDQFKIYLPLV